jgi:hypothetical protein
MAGQEGAQIALERIAALQAENEALKTQSQVLTEANGILEASNRALKSLLFEVSEALGESSMVQLTSLYPRVYELAQDGVLPGDVSARIAALEKLTPPGGVKGTALNRVLGEKGEGWTLSIGQLNAPKLFFTGDTIEDVLSQAEAELPNVGEYEAKAAQAGVIRFG